MGASEFLRRCTCGTCHMHIDTHIHIGQRPKTLPPPPPPSSARHEVHPAYQATLCVLYSNPHERLGGWAARPPVVDLPPWRRHGVLTDVLTRNVLADTPRILNHPLTRLGLTDNCHRAAAHPKLSQSHVLRNRHSKIQQHSVYTNYFPPFNMRGESCRQWT